MPSRNSINKPKISAPKRRSKGPAKVGLPKDGSTASPVTQERAISKKRAKKLSRNAAYLSQHLQKQVDGNNPDVEMDLDGLSKTQQKLKQRQLKIAQGNQILLNLQDQQNSEMDEVSMDSFGSGKGTTLGRPPVLSDYQ